MNTTKKTVISAMLAALCCVATMIIKIPSPLHGYVNLGDCVVLLSGFLLSPFYGFFAAAIGSALADVFSGYLMYAPATFIIKGMMALAAHFLYGKLRRYGKIPAKVISGTVSELIMIVGYLVFESVIYGFVPSLANIPSNVVQGVAGLVLGVAVSEIFERNKIF